MKKFLFALCLFAGCLCAGAQGKHEINFYLGGSDATFMTLEDNSAKYHSDLYAMYEPSYNYNCGPSLTLDYNYNVLGWLLLGGQVNYSTIEGTRWYRLGDRPDVQFNYQIFSVLPQAKIHIPSSRHFRLYAKVAAGLQLRVGEMLDVSPLRLAWDVAPIGAEWGGNRFYGTAELCVGNVICGGRIGVGFRF